ncbi:alpha-L-fucosidase [Novipirellula artificiosorum]|uniref:alpha-L-fucosidase n=1 Tax=Novipirellula artificiosorum TaxID=2528016 RepID=A0A5C6DIV6_9BACT|nr:alpha-L-fucosidase [Novipirellula artificiosorum]TWU36155.1 Alpha-L-fucosidase [Novipirellula artificiosorum]
MQRTITATLVALTLSLLTHSAEAETFAPTWDSLSKHQAAPEWFQDAKVGIYFHWGVYTVPAYQSEWYPFFMHRPGDVFDHHVKTYGHPSKFGYHDFVPLFTAEHFDPEDWAELFRRAGAKFAGPVAEHHDGFAMWDSEATPWNAKDRGPKRDVTGELFRSLRTRDMKTIATFHHARNLQRYPVMPEPKEGVDRHFGSKSHYLNVEGYPTSSEDPELRRLYGNMPEAEWLDEIWFAKLKEVIDQYNPDIIWFDSWLNEIPEPYRQKFAAYYLNHAEKEGREVVIVRKQDDLPLSFTVNDHEKSREPKALPETWMTDDTISKGSWCYTNNLTIKGAPQVVHSMIDTVSKNGIMLLNVSPKSDGSIPDDQRAVLAELGDWLRANGEAIYATRIWQTYGEGPTQEPEGGFKSHAKFTNLQYSEKDVRYTQSKDGKNVYAMILGWPGAGKTVTLKSFGKLNPGASTEVDVVSLVEGGDSLQWSRDDDGLHVVMPAAAPNEIAIAIKIQ